MRFVLFTHSLVSDWNHGNAHFLRGIVRELTARGHEVRVLEPRNGWSRENLLADQGSAALERFRDFPFPVLPRRDQRVVPSAYAAPAFEGDFRTVLYDNVGAGGSDLAAYDPAKYGALTGYADDLVDLCRELELTDAVFVGHSVSAKIGVLASLKAPVFVSACSPMVSPTAPAAAPAIAPTVPPATAPTGPPTEPMAAPAAAPARAPPPVPTLLLLS